jgi:hypothetical protein
VFGGGTPAGSGGTGGTTAGTGGSTAGHGGGGGSVAGRGGGTGGSVAGRGGSGGTAGSTGGVSGHGGSGGVGGASGTGGSVGPPPCKFASFDQNAEGFALSPYNTSPGNLLLREAGPAATMTWSATDGDPAPGSLRIDAPFSDYNQLVDATIGFAGTRNLANTRLHVRVKIASGLDQSASSPPGVQVYANSYNSGDGGLGYHWKGNWTTVSVGHGWADYVLDLLADADFDPTQISNFGVTIESGNGVIDASGTVNPVKPTPAIIYVDSFWFEGNCTGGMGGFGEGGAGGSTDAGCRASDPPPSALITDFSVMDAGTPFFPIGGIFTYSSINNAPVPTATVMNGAWHVTLNAPGMAAAQYAGVGLFFSGNPSGTDCIDASAYTGVSFKIAGSVEGAGCTVEYSVTDSEHSDPMSNPKGSGPTGAYSPQLAASAGQITPTGQTVTILFSGVGSPLGGNPATPIDRTKLTGVQWQFNVPPGTTNACTADITLDDVKFVP